MVLSCFVSKKSHYMITINTYKENKKCDLIRVVGWGPQKNIIYIKESKVYIFVTKFALPFSHTNKWKRGELVFLLILIIDQCPRFSLPLFNQVIKVI